jgi:hypothetical protein
VKRTSRDPLYRIPSRPRSAIYAAAIAALLIFFSGCASRSISSPLRSAPNRCADDLLSERERAVSRGLDWLEAFLDDDRHLADLGSDAVEIFLEAGMTAPSADLRQRCLTVANRYAAKLLPRYLENGALQEHGNLGAAWTLVARSEELKVPMDELIVKLAARMQSITTFPEEYHVNAVDASTVALPDLMMFVVHAYLLEKLRMLRPEINSLPRFREALARLNDDAFWPRAAEDDEFPVELGYIATHVYYALNDYGRLSVSRGDAPAAWDFMRRELPKAIEVDELELVAEFIDIFHSAGLSESTDPEMCEATRLLLAEQNADGSWGTRTPDEDSYDIVHPTWTAVDALRARVFLRATKFDKHRRTLITEAINHGRRRADRQRR